MYNTYFLSLYNKSLTFYIKNKKIIFSRLVYKITTRRRRIKNLKHKLDLYHNVFSRIQTKQICTNTPLLNFSEYKGKIN